MNEIAILEEQLREILGGTYGGPSLSYEKGRQKFVIYSWYDAPVGDDILAEGATISETITNFRKLIPK